MPTSFSTKARLCKMTGMALLMPAVVIAVLIAINRFDEPLSPDTQAWLNYPAPQAQSQSFTQPAKVESALHAYDLPAAYREWADRQRRWQKAAAEAMTVDGLLQTAVQLEHGQTDLAGMLKQHPQSIDMARQLALPVLQSQVSLQPLFSRALVYQFQLAAQAIAAKAQSPADADGVAERLYRLFYQPNASLNLANRIMRDYMAKNGIALNGKPPVADSASPPCKSEKNWLALSNQYGRHLICMARLDYSAQRKHLAAVDAGTESLKKAMQ